MNHRLLFFALPFALFTSLARGAFINDVEHFDGTALDTNAWVAASPAYLDMLVDGALHLELGEVTSSLKLGVGQGVRVTMTRHPHTPDYQHPGVVLTDYYHPEGGPYYNTRWVGIVSYGDPLASEQDFISVDGVNGPVSGQSFEGSRVALTQPFQLEILRLSLSDFKFSMSDTAGRLIGSHTRDVTAYSGRPVPQLLMIQLRGPGATFDDVTIIPEPALLSVFASMLLFRRMRGTGTRITKGKNRMGTSLIKGDTTLYLAFRQPSWRPRGRMVDCRS